MAKPKQPKPPVYKQLPYSTTPPGAVTPDRTGGQGFKGGPLDLLAYALAKKYTQAPD